MDVHACRCILRRHSHPLDPQPTGVEPVLNRLEGIRAVVFDIYGTLIVSASGDIGAGGRDGLATAAEAAMRAVGLENPTGAPAVEALNDEIRADHASSRQEGVEHPEVDIVEIWGRVLARLGICPSEVDTLALAVHYEARTNPTWPMPGLAEILSRLRERKLLLGIVSNAQIFTADLFPALLGETLPALGFNHDLMVYSYRHGQAKPGRFLYDRVAKALEAREIAPEETLYVGNDMLKDVWPAQQVGFRTALFAGDARSYRPRTDDPRVANVVPDLVLTELAAVEGCLA